MWWYVPKALVGGATGETEGMNPTTCRSCGEPMAPGADRAPSLGNPNQCVPCCTGHQLPAEGSAAYRATDGPTTLPPATAPAACISGDAGPETTAAGGNPFPSGRWTTLARGCEPKVPAAVPASKPADSHAAGACNLCIKCGAAIEEPWLATVCCADCRAGFRVPAPTRSGVHYMGPAYSPEDCDAWRMLL